ncbi:MAG: ABC transporter transmembrane domain-containing protein, partial [Caulobacterales bacterium]
MDAAPPTAERRSAIIRLLKEFGGRHWRLFLIIAPAMLVVALASASYGLLVKWALDRLNGGDQQAVILAPVLVLIAAFSKAVALYIQTLMTNRFAYGIVVDLQSAMFGRLIESDYVRFSRETSGSMISRFTNDVNVVSEGLVRASNSLLRDALIVIFCLAAMLATDWMLTLLMVALFPIITGPLASIGARARRQVRAAQEQAGDLTAQLSESLSAPRMIKTYALEDYER